MTPHSLLLSTLGTVLIYVLADSVAYAQDSGPQPRSESAEQKAPENSEIEVGDKHDEAQQSSEPGAASPARPEADAASEPPKREDDDDPIKKFTVGGYIETFYQWNFNNPGNGISNYRGYDTRHNSITIQNAVVDVGFRAKDVLARLALQTGLVGPTTYQDEPDQAGSLGAGESNSSVWRYLQRASVGWQASSAVLLEAGLFPSTTGVESLAVKENWNWSRSLASTRLPTYQAGARANFAVSDQVDMFAAVVNGWNNVVDNNDEKSGIVGVQFKVKNKLTLSGSYFGGVERDGGAAEGRPWRHGFESWAQYDVTERVSVAIDGSAGLEDTNFGVHWWTSGAVYGRAKIFDWFFVATRLTRVWEERAATAAGTSDPILIPAKNVTSLTATLDFRPVKGFSTRLEYQHDDAASPMFFRGNVEGDGSEARPYVPNANSQNTLLLGVVAWF